MLHLFYGDTSVITFFEMKLSATLGETVLSVQTRFINNSTPLCDNGGSFCTVGVTADLFARVAMPNFHGLWTFHISTCERFDGFAL